MTRTEVIELLKRLRAGELGQRRGEVVLDAAIHELETSFGPTGELPEGQLDPTDRGQLTMGISAKEGKVIVAFGVPCDWLGFGPAQARTIAKMLEANAAAADRQRVEQQLANNTHAGETQAEFQRSFHGRGARIPPKES